MTRIGINNCPAYSCKLFERLLNPGQLKRDFLHLKDFSMRDNGTKFWRLSHEGLSDCNQSKANEVEVLEKAVRTLAKGVGLTFLCQYYAGLFFFPDLHLNIPACTGLEMILLDQTFYTSLHLCF
jgi:hypothetical protein